MLFPRNTSPLSGVIAKPPIRKLAKDLGVELGELVGTGQGGEILRDDVVRATARDGLFREASKPQALEEREHRFPVKGVRKVIAENMVASKFEAPHVSVFVEVDATRTMEFVKRLKQSSAFEGVKVSPLLIFAKALLWAVGRNPEVNAQWTDEEIIVKHYVNLGIAAATPRGLVVPNIKEAQDMSLIELAGAIQQMTEDRPSRAHAARRYAARHDHDLKLWCVRYGLRHADSEPQRGRDLGDGFDSAEAVGGRGAGDASLGHHGWRLVRPPCGRR